MNILFAYDGSRSSNEAIEDLEFAGLPLDGTSLTVISIAEVWMPPPPGSNGNGNGNGNGGEPEPVFVSEWSERRLKVAKSAVNEAETLSRHARDKIAAKFPKWDVQAFATYGSPAWEILAYAKKIGVDLIMIGSQGRSAIGRILLGSVSQKILAEADCSVRIARNGASRNDSTYRLLIGFDGSVGSEYAVERVASGNWPESVEVKLVWAAQSAMPSTIGRFISPAEEFGEDRFEDEKTWVEKLAENSLRTLKNGGINATIEVIEGNPKEVIVSESASWNANTVFVGAHSYSSALEKYLIGCNSAAIAERAECTVEAVRGNTD